MTIEEIKNHMKKNKITYEILSEKSGIPIGTLKQIFRGATQNPRIDTMQAIEKALGLDEEHQALQQMYFHLGKEAQELGLCQEDIDLMLNFFRIHKERNKNNNKPNKDNKDD